MLPWLRTIIDVLNPAEGNGSFVAGLAETEQKCPVLLIPQKLLCFLPAHKPHDHAATKRFKKTLFEKDFFAINYLCVKRKKEGKHYFLNLKSYPSFQRSTKCFWISSRMPSIQFQPVLSCTHTCARTDFISWRLNLALSDTQLQTRTLTLENLDQWTSSSGPPVRNGQFSFQTETFRFAESIDR